ncbi:MAG TPA: mandelate racemase/muconate lactonizing enzyme family protein [Bryobacteraceae bacterium]|jgi:L-alanine-DL-glutamate epimerase-like enolase superfamily enzyme|nr:mandelate racemase/muconate lactonizing enzyme family protein [Bryobacteraceae bacterium]
MKITRIDCHVLLDPGYDAGATSSSQDDIVVEIHTDEGLTGIGESDVNPWIARACIEAPGTHTMGLSLEDMLLGEDPLAVESLWQKLYTGSAMNGRRGAVIHALGALDMALHDLRAKAADKPCYEFLGGAAKPFITPYASLQPEVDNFNAYRESLIDWARRAQSLGFKAAKIEVTPSGPYRHRSLDASYEEMTELIAEVRRTIGEDFVLMVDVQYAFPNAETCLKAIRPWQEFNLFFLETPLPSDDLAGYAEVATKQPIPIAAGEWLATRFEFLDLMDRGKVQVAQPDVGRVGGMSEAKRVCDLATARGLTIVPHLWKSGISIAAAAHLSAATAQCAFIEFLPAELCESALRRELVQDELKMENGILDLPRKAGLGVSLNRDALERFKEAAEKAWRDRDRKRHPVEREPALGRH